MRLVVEQEAVDILSPYFEALGMEIVGFDELTNEVVIRHTGKRLKLHGESKDGEIFVSRHDDIGGMVAIAEKLFDRVYGKPKQQTTIEGGQQPIRVQPVASEDHARAVAELLANARAIPVDAEGEVVSEQ